MILMSTSCDLLWIGDSLGSATVIGAVGRGVLPRLEQTYQMRVAALGWPSGDDPANECDLDGAVLLPDGPAWDAEAIGWALAELQPRVVVTCSDSEQIASLGELLRHESALWVAYVNPSDDALEASVIKTLRQADAVVTDRPEQADRLTLALGRPCRVLGLGVDPDCFRPLTARRALRTAAGIEGEAIIGCWGGPLELPRGLELLRWLGEARSAGNAVALLLALEPQARLWQYGDYSKRLKLGSCFREIGDLWQRSRQEGDGAFNELLNLLDVLVIGCPGPETRVLALEAAAAGVVVVSASEWMGPDSDLALPHRLCQADGNSLEPRSLMKVLDGCVSDPGQLGALGQTGRDLAIARSWEVIAEDWHRLVRELLSGTESGEAATGPRHGDAKPRTSRPATQLSLAVERFVSAAGTPAAEDGCPSVAVLTPCFYDPMSSGQGVLPVMGGGERYLVDLAKVLVDLGFKVDAFQPSSEPWKRRYGELTVYGLGVDGVHYDTHPAANLVFHEVTEPYDHVIYHTFAMCHPRSRPGSIALSHGIWWDVETDGWWRSAEWRRRIFECIEQAGTLVSVDTNTLNWVRAERPDLSPMLRYLPNAVDVKQYHPDDGRIESEEVTILFPRRLVPGRGFALMLDIARDMVVARGDLRFRFVGRGSALAEAQMQELAQRQSRIQWEWRRLEEMPEVYRSSDITVIPSLFSEGTSLSCLEAMASGNAVIATNVGGLGNLILDGYNGLLVEPNREAIQAGILRLAEDADLRGRLGRRAVETAQAFSSSRWREAWTDLLSQCGIVDANRRGRLMGPQVHREGDGQEAVRIHARSGARAIAEPWTAPAQRQLLPAEALMRPIILIMSGCYWDAEGGAQRPVALARELSTLGMTVIYYNSDQRQTTEERDGVWCVGPGEWSAWLVYLRGLRGIVQAALPAYAPDAMLLRRNGWRLTYDLLDDWDSFFRAGDMGVASLDESIVRERMLIAVSDFVTCSATVLIEQARKRGCLSPHLVRNGGPEGMLPTSPMPEDMLAGKIRVVYSGHLAGSWFDWGILKELDECEDLAVTVVGALGQGEARWEHTIPVERFERVRFVGARPYADAMRYVVNAHVGIVPFQGDLSAAVDPIKRWDYAAAGIWTIGTPELTELEGEPFVLLAPRGQFADAVRKAARKRSRPDLDYVTGNSWRARAEQIADLAVEALRPKLRPTMKPKRVVRGYDEWNLRVTWAGPAACNANPPCPYCCTIVDRGMRPARFPVAPAELQEALERFTLGNGPCLLSVCWGESLVDDDMARIVGSLGEFNRVDLVTNLVFPIERLRWLGNRPNFALCTSFHPHLWGMSTEGFIAKRRAIEAEGIHCGVTEIVAYPDWFAQLPQWFAEFRAAGISASVLPYQGTHPLTGTVYPGAYTEAEWDWLKANVIVYHQDLRNSVFDGSRPPTGRLCSAGKNYVFLDWSGEIKRCVIPQHGGVPDSLGSIFGEYALLTAPTPCGGTACPCADLWQFIEPE
jgi:glycosyltransferase involved in cell wall biosynthesis